LLPTVTSLFPLWALLAALLAYARPALFVPAQAAIVPLLGLVMFGMGVTLAWGSFAEVFRHPRVVALGLSFQYALMPLFAWIIALGMGLPAELMAGLVVVGACLGGTASNVVCYLARGDVALSITLTALSTLLAILATPFLTWLYVGQRVPVPVDSMLWSIFEVVLLPVTAGLLVNTLAARLLRPIKALFPMISMGAICFIIAIVVALNRDRLAVMGAGVAVAVMLHNGAGLATGYWLPRLLGYDERTCRALAIEVGMQNSGLAVFLAVKYFSAAAALPGAVFSVWHNLSGSVLASLWSRRPTGTRED
jgi:BASS family bile acid:Na+ symporter